MRGGRAFGASHAIELLNGVRLTQWGAPSRACFDLETMQANDEPEGLVRLKAIELFLVMQRACEMLVDRPQSSIGEIAADLGYANPSKFSKAFSECVGVTPRAWRSAQSRPSGSRRFHR